MTLVPIQEAESASERFCNGTERHNLDYLRLSVFRWVHTADRPSVLGVSRLLCHTQSGFKLQYVARGKQTDGSQAPVDAAFKPQAINQPQLSAMSCCLSVDISKLITEMYSISPPGPEAPGPSACAGQRSDRPYQHTGWSRIMRPGFCTNWHTNKNKSNYLGSLSDF